MRTYGIVATALLIAGHLMRPGYGQVEGAWESVWGNPFKGAAISITPSMPEYTLGERIDLWLWFKNVGDKKVTLLYSGHRHSCRVALFYADGRPVPESRPARQAEGTVTSDFPPSLSTQMIRLGPGETEHGFQVITLNPLFKIDAEGTYRVLVMFCPRKWAEGFAISNLATFRVVGAKEKAEDAGGSSAAGGETWRSPIGSLQSADPTQRVSARTRILKERRSLVRSLMIIAQTQTRVTPSEQAELLRLTSPKYLAIRLLGELRAEEAIRTLLRNLTYYVDMSIAGSLGGRGLGARYPAAGSLAKIGNPAVPKLLGFLSGSTDRLEPHLCVWTLIRIEGRDVARLRVEKATKDCRPYGNAKANLEAALEYFEKEDLEFAPREESGESAPPMLMDLRPGGEASPGYSGKAVARTRQANHR